MNLLQALRIPPQAAHTLALAGAGGKTTALFQLARQTPAALAASSTHFGAWQSALADRHVIANEIEDVRAAAGRGVTLVTGGVDSERIKPVSAAMLDELRRLSVERQIPLLIEADGSRQKPLKAPAAHEPPIPEFSDSVLYVMGLSALGAPLNEERVQRAEIFAALSGLTMGERISPQAMMRAAAHPQGGLKNIPAQARKIALLNQADTPQLESIGGKMAQTLLGAFDAVLVAALERNRLCAIERCAGVVLAAGQSKRFGESKALLNWRGKPFIRQIVETALRARLEPVMVVAGKDAARIESALAGLPAQVIYNPRYELGQSESIKAGVAALPRHIGGAVFLLADQPHIPAEVILALQDVHARELPAIVAPLVQEERRANPVLFDRATFEDLSALQGDVGGRALFSKYRVSYLPWNDEALLLDVDVPADYERLKAHYNI
ncbi:MAG: molybdenum cofactor cytidylyltransferase [Anaerolineales bacterium]